MADAYYKWKSHALQYRRITFFCGLLFDSFKILGRILVLLTSFAPNIKNNLNRSL